MPLSEVLDRGPVAMVLPIDAYQVWPQFSRNGKAMLLTRNRRVDGEVESAGDAFGFTLTVRHNAPRFW